MAVKEIQDKFDGYKKLRDFHRLELPLIEQSPNLTEFYKGLK